MLTNVTTTNLHITESWDETGGRRCSRLNDGRQIMRLADGRAMLTSADRKRLHGLFPTFRLAFAAAELSGKAGMGGHTQTAWTR